MTMQEHQDAPELQKVEKIVKKLQNPSQERRTLLSSEEVIESYRNENFELKFQLARLKRASKKEIEEFNFEEIESDLVESLMSKNLALRKQIELHEREKRELVEQKKNRLVEIGCQTNLDGYNIEELLRCRIALRKQKEHARNGVPLAGDSAPASLGYAIPTTNDQNNPKMPYQFDPTLTQITYNHMTQQTLLQDQTDMLPPFQAATVSAGPTSTTDKLVQPGQHQVLTQLNYPSVTIPTSVTKNTAMTTIPKEPLSTDERDLLETLYRVDGIMTTVLAKVKAAADTYPN